MISRKEFIHYMSKEYYSLGIDIGSTTVKVAVLNKDNEILFSDYQRHFANIQETLAQIVKEAMDHLGSNIEISHVITGSGGLALATQLGVGGTQSMMSILESQVMSTEQKLGTLQVLFAPTTRTPTGQAMLRLPVGQTPARPATTRQAQP